MAEQKPLSLEQLIEEEALRIAKGIQAPGQTKEQTKLIAKGIEKGIALYKRQQSEKEREREKARKRVLKQRLTPGAPPLSDTGPDQSPVEPGCVSVRRALFSAGTLLMVVALLQLVRVVTGFPWTVGEFSIPLGGSVAAALLFGGVGVWCLWSTRNAVSRSERQ